MERTQETELELDKLDFGDWMHIRGNFRNGATIAQLAKSFRLSETAIIHCLDDLCN